MLANRIRTGFHRIGIVGVTACGVAAVVAAFAVGALRGEAAGLAFGFACLLVGLAFYATAWAIGWIAAGFAGE
jgi:hypothetical protein